MKSKTMKSVILILTVLLCLFGCAEKKEEEEIDMNTDRDMEVTLRKDYGNMNISIQGPAEGSDIYEVSLEVKKGEAFQTVYSLETYSEFLSGRKIVAWYLQEGGQHGTMRFCVKARKDGKLIAKDVSEEFESTEAVPEKEELLFGEDIPIEGIVSFSYSGTGSSREQNFSYSIADFDGWIYEASYVDTSNGDDVRIEEKLKEEDRRKIFDVIAKGKMVLRTISDPQYQRLDGSDEYLSLSYEGEDILTSLAYEYSCSKEVREELISLLKGIR